MGKTNFEQCPKNAYLMLISRTWAWSIQIFCNQKKRKVKLDKVREGLRPITFRFRAKAQKLILGSIGTPLDHLSVNTLCEVLPEIHFDHGQIKIQTLFICCFVLLLS